MNRLIISKILSRRIKRNALKEERAIDTAAIGDMAFLLLIFFIVTCSFVLRQGIFFSLPSATASARRVEASQLINVYPENNGFTYNDKLLQREQLKDILVEQNKQVKNAIFVIKMKEKVRYERLVDTLSLAEESGLREISLKDIIEGEEEKK